MVYIKIFVAAVLGWAMVSSLVQLLRFCVLVYLSQTPDCQTQDAINVYGILTLILIVRPAGILGKNVKEKV